MVVDPYIVSYDRARVNDYMVADTAFAANLHTSTYHRKMTNNGVVRKIRRWIDPRCNGNGHVGIDGAAGGCGRCEDILACRFPSMNIVACAAGPERAQGAGAGLERTPMAGIVEPILLLIVLLWFGSRRTA